MVNDQKLTLSIPKGQVLALSIIFQRPFVFALFFFLTHKAQSPLAAPCASLGSPRDPLCSIETTL